MPGPVRFAGSIKAYATDTVSFGRGRAQAGGACVDTVDISEEAYTKSKEYLIELQRQYSSVQTPQETQAGNNLEILNLPADASRDQIRKAYLGAMKKYHPDNFAGLSPEFRELAEEKSKQINLAYKKLTTV